MPVRSASILMLAAIAAAPLGADPVVTTDRGAVRGTELGNVDIFKGIPFAAPPVGALRWRAPQPAARWRGERDATVYAADCMQKPFPSDAAPLGTKPAEDCLYANVWRPRGARGLPVLVWIYGGGFVNGGSSPPTYSGDRLAARGIVVVSFNYRLGRFGAFGHPALTKADADHGLLYDYGYLDQIAALKWVRRNIAAFGGDPAKVTIMGESAGGMSVHNLMTSPLSQGLFRAAVIESGGPSPIEPSPADITAAGVAFARQHGIGGSDDTALDRLRAFPAEAVVDGLNLASPAPQSPRTYVGPAIDGRIARDPLAAYRSGHFAHVPVMVGATSDDIGGADGMMIGGARTVAQTLAASVPTYYYRFSYVAGSARTPDTKGAGHATDIPFFLDTAAIKYGAATTTADRTAARLASDYLVQFVKTGDPNGDGRPAWPRYTNAARPMLNLNEAGGADLVRDR